MSDTLEVGGIEAKLTVDSSQFDEGMDESKEKLNGFLTSVNTLPPNIQKLILKEQELTRQLQEQRQKIAEMDAALDAAKETYADMQLAVNRYSDADMVSHFEKEDEAIQKEEDSLSSLAQKIKFVEQQRAEAQAKINQKLGLEEQASQYRSASLAIDSVANSLRGLSPVLGDTIGNVSNLAGRVTALKQSLNAAKTSGVSTGAVIGSAVAGGVTLAISAVTTLISAIQKAEEERKQMYEQAMADMAEYDQQVREIQQSMGILDDAASGTSDMLNARQQLAELFPDIIVGYEDENAMLLGNSEIMQDQVNTLKEAVRLQREKLALEADGKFDDYDSKKEKVADLEEQIKTMEKEIQENQKILDDAEKNGGLSREAAMGIKTFSNDAELLALKKKLNTAKTEMNEAYNDVFYGLSAKISMGIDDFENLNDVQGKVYDNMVLNARDYIMSAEDETEANRRVQETIENIKSVLADEKTYTDRYQLIIDADPTAMFSDDQISMIDAMGQEYMDKLKEERKKAHEKEIKGLEEKYDGLYEARKAAIDSEYEAVETSLKAQQDAYKQLSFTVKSLDEQDLANKIDLLDRRVKAEQDAQAKAVLAIQDRYYKETQLIIQTANKEIQTYKDKLVALDQADADAEAARKARQDQAAIRDLNESLAKQEAENAREMAAALEEYETERDRLQAVIDNPPSQTARILAERELTELNESWLKEREQLEAEHSEKVIKIQRELDEEKLTQQEDAAAAERDKERESLNEQITDAENTAKQKLAILNNSYTVEAEAQEKALSDQLTREKEVYQTRLDNLKTSLDNELEAEKKKAEERYEQSVSDENLIAEAKKYILSKSQDEMLEMLDKYAEEARKKGKSFGAMYMSGMQEGLASGADDHIVKNYTLPAGVQGPQLIEYDDDYVLRKMMGLPGYATGGIVDKKQLAWVAEDEPEAIIPMSKMHDFVNGILSKSQAESQEVLNNAWSAMQRMKLAMNAGDTYNTSSHVDQSDQSRTVHIENVNISRTVDFDLASAQVRALMGGRR